MAKKAQLLAEAKKLKLDVTEKNTIKEIEEALANAGSGSPSKPEKPTETATKPAAKAGKRSTKGLQEAEEKQAKIERQHESTEEPGEAAKPKKQQKPARPKHERKGKNYREAFKLVDQSKTYSLKEAADLAIKTSKVKFDSTVELHVRLGVDPKQADQNVRDTVVLPAGSGKSVRIAVFCETEDVAGAKKAGADIAAADEFLEKLEKSELDFDILISTPVNMPKLGKYARILGPKGLMPNPKSGTVTKDVVKAVAEAKAGKVEYRVDSTSIVHIGVGKASFGADKLAGNLAAVLRSIKLNKPASLKGNYIESVYLTTTMGPSVKVNLSEL